MAELLLELLSEEIPARMQQQAAADLRRLATENLGKLDLSFERAEAFVTPRRLTLVVNGLPDRQPDAREEKRGPRVGAPEQAVEGFLKANGLASVDQAEIRETEKGSFYFVIRNRKGEATARVLAAVLQDVLDEMPWPKSMRWNSYGFRWVRPMHNILAVFDGKAIDFRFEMNGSDIPLDPGHRQLEAIDAREPIRHPGTLVANNRTVGHRFLAPGPIEVTSFDDYRAKLRAAKVMINPAERREAIVKRSAQLAEAERLMVRQDPDLLGEVAGLVEWPVVLMGAIDPQFMTLPHEVLTTVMRTHQKYFSLDDQAGTLAERFLVVSNMETADRGAAVVSGNERVLRARLSDAQFFWDQDRKQPLAERVSALQGVVFHAKLGSLLHKVDRMEALVVDIAGSLSGVSVDLARRAARLCKADLTTGMVGEFPELQGVMGRYYASHDGEPDEVAEAIAEHYSPLGPDDACPTAPVSVVVALADKLDTLVGFFSMDERPTGSKDPYALRRSALGAIRIIVENGLRLPLCRILVRAYELQPEQAHRTFRHLLMANDAARLRVAESIPEMKLPEAEELTSVVLEFLAERLKVALKGEGVRHDLISAVFAVNRPNGGIEDDLVRLLARVRALGSFLESDDGANLLTAYRRAANIVRIEAKKDGRTYFEVEPALFQQAEENVLWRELSAVQDRVRGALEREAFAEAMAALAQLRAPVDALFDRVTVNTDDRERRTNRLALLRSIVMVMNQAAEFSRIEGERAP